MMMTSRSTNTGIHPIVGRSAGTMTTIGSADVCFEGELRMWSRTTTTARRSRKAITRLLSLVLAAELRSVVFCGIFVLLCRFGYILIVLDDVVKINRTNLL